MGLRTAIAEAARHKVEQKRLEVEAKRARRAARRRGGAVAG
ncbi:hypothetical protein [Tsukamurella sp. PLM1]|nr:hypothetical protein [Tsukamurella sp. PLM1]